MLVIGSRGSQLALWQSRFIAEKLKERGVDTRIEVIKTTGDKVLDVALSKVGTKGMFTKELEEALLEKRIDIAVHSLKDMPTEVPERLAIAAIPERADHRDCVVGKRIGELSQGARVGTSSPRRAAQLQFWRPDLVVEPVRGNVDTRLRKLDAGLYDAILLAAAGLGRLGWGERIAEVLPVSVMCPAAGQGALSIETRDDDPAFEVCAALDHGATHVAVTAERAVLAGLGGGCLLPAGAYAEFREGRLHIEAVVAAPHGKFRVTRETMADACDAERAGRALARELLDGGGAGILEALAG